MGIGDNGGGSIGGSAGGGSEVGSGTIKNGGIWSVFIVQVNRSVGSAVVSAVIYIIGF